MNLHHRKHRERADPRLSPARTQSPIVQAPHSALDALGMGQLPDAPLACSPFPVRLLLVLFAEPAPPTTVPKVIHMGSAINSLGPSTLRDL